MKVKINVTQHHIDTVKRFRKREGSYGCPIELAIWERLALYKDVHNPIAVSVVDDEITIDYLKYWDKNKCINKVMDIVAPKSISTFLDKFETKDKGRLAKPFSFYLNINNE